MRRFPEQYGQGSKALVFISNIIAYIASAFQVNNHFGARAGVKAQTASEAYRLVYRFRIGSCFPQSKGNGDERINKFCSAGK